MTKRKNGAKFDVQSKAIQKKSKCKRRITKWGRVQNKNTWQHLQEGIVKAMIGLITVKEAVLNVSLDIQAFKLLYLLSEKRMVKLQASFTIPPAYLMQCTEDGLDEGSYKPLVDWVVFTALCKFRQSKAEQLPYIPSEYFLQHICRRFERIFVDMPNLLRHLGK